MAEKSKGKLEALAKKAKAFGIDFEGAFAEFKQQVIQEIKSSQTEIKKEELIQAVKSEVAGDIQALIRKLEQAAAGSDPQAMVGALAEALQPEITRVSQQTFQEGAKALMEQIRQENERALKALEEKLLALNPNGGSGESRLVEAPVAARGDLTSLVAALFGNLDKIKERVEVFRPPAAHTDIALLLKGMSIGNKLKTGELSVDDLTKALLPEQKQ
jgi:AcrR family transcriptional regulator